MTAIKLIAATTLAFTLLTLGMASTAHAQSAEQSQNVEQEYEIECNSGSYGQNTTCKVKGTNTAWQNQKIAGRLRDGVMYHKPVDTALDNVTLVAAGALITAGVGAAVIKNKIK